MYNSLLLTGIFSDSWAVLSRPKLRADSCKIEEDDVWLPNAPPNINTDINSGDSLGTKEGGYKIKTGLFLCT